MKAAAGQSELQLEDLMNAIVNHRVRKRAADEDAQPINQQVVAAPAGVEDRPEQDREERERAVTTQLDVVVGGVAAASGRDGDRRGEMQNVGTDPLDDRVPAVLIGAFQRFGSRYRADREGNVVEDEIDEYAAEAEPLREAPIGRGRRRRLDARGIHLLEHHPCSLLDQSGREPMRSRLLADRGSIRAGATRRADLRCPGPDNQGGPPLSGRRYWPFAVVDGMNNSSEALKITAYFRLFDERTLEVIGNACPTVARAALDAMRPRYAGGGLASRTPLRQGPTVAPVGSVQHAG